MSTEPAGDLAAMVERFREEKRYPTPEHEEQKRLREEWREKLLPENVESAESSATLSPSLECNVRERTLRVAP